MRRPALALAALLAPLLAAGCGRADGVEPLRDELAGCNVLVTLIDACAAGHLASYGYDRATTPYLDRLAGESVLFEDVTAAAPYTLASVASLMTGEQVDMHGVTEAGDVLPEDTTLLAEAFRGAGYATSGLSTNAHVRARFDFDRGFDVFESLRPDLADGRPHAVPEAMVDAARAFVEAPPAEPWFAYWHFMPPHAPYDPPPPHRDAFAARLPDAAPGSLAYLSALTAGAAQAGPAEREAIVDLYDSGLRYVDAVLADLGARLEASGALERTLWIVLSDHGEAFGEHGIWQHSGNVHRELLHVPLLVRLPGARRAGTRVAAPVSLVDVYATLADLLRLDAAPRETGTSLAGLLAGEPALEGGRDLPIVARTAGRRPHRSLRRGAHKVIWREAEDRWQLYDLEGDPNETDDLARRRPRLLALLREELEVWADRAARRERRRRRIELDESLREELGEIGYGGD